MTCGSLDASTGCGVTSALHAYAIVRPLPTRFHGVRGAEITDPRLPPLWGVGRGGKKPVPRVPRPPVDPHTLCTAF